MSESVHSAEYKRLLAMLVAHRKKAGLNQRELSARLKRPHSYCGKVELGERRLDVVELTWYLRALDVEPKKFLVKFLETFKDE